MTSGAANSDGSAMLSGLRIVEVSAFIAAPLCGLTLAQLGADVIRIDPPGGNIDIGRLPRAPSGRSLYWSSLNRGKRSVEIDFRKPEGKALVRRILASSGKNGGILVTNLALDGELGFEALREARRDLIMVRLSGSPDGRSEVDYTVNCAVGFPFITGDVPGQPVNHVLPAWDAIAGLTLATAVLAAERRRRETGEGQLVELALSDVAMSMASNLAYIADVEINGAERMPDANFVYGAYGDAFRTADGRYIMVVAISNRQWLALVQALEVEPGLRTAAQALGFNLDDERGRYEARELISASFRPWFLRRTLAEVAAVFAGRPLLWGPYRTFAQMLGEDPRCSTQNPMFQRVEHPDVGSVLTASSPIDFVGVPRVPAGTAPRLGEHTAAVLQELLALRPEEIAPLAAGRIVGSARTKETGN